MSYIKNGGNKAEAPYLFQVSRATIYRWCRLGDDLTPKPLPHTRHRKIDKALLCRNIDGNTDL